MYKFAFTLALAGGLISQAFGVTVSSPSNGSTVGSPVHFVAKAGSTSCSKGVASMGIYKAPGDLAYSVNGTSLDTYLSLSPGTYYTTVQQWDYCGGSSKANITVTVGSATGVYVSSPANNSTVSSPAHFVATAMTSTCSKGVASMGIYTAPYQKAYTVGGDKLDTYLSLAAGTYNTHVTEWDYCGGATTKAVTFTVGSSATPKITTGGKTFYNVQASSGWRGYGELPPTYNICSSCGSGLSWSMQQGIGSPSMDGKATKYSISGTTPYADVLWNNHLIGDLTSQGMADKSHTLVNTLHNFTYDAYFYGSNLSLAENIEFDIGQFFNSMQFMFGTQCQIVNGQVWGIWDSAHGHWVSTSVPCKPKSNQWNHVVIQFQRTSDNYLVYKSITLNGVTTTLNAKYGHASAPSSWWGVVANFQLDGNHSLSDYSVYVDKLNVSYY